MTIGITAPELGKSDASGKDLVISVLMHEFPLTLTKLTNSIRKKYHVSITFQGVRKAVNQLVESGVVTKEGKEYSLNKDWILDLRDFVEQLQESYFTESTGIKDIQAIGEDLKVYTFDNLIDLDKFWNNIIGKWFDEDAGSTHKKYYVQQSGHTWYVLGQLEEETAILDKIKKHKINFYTLANGDTFLDRWCRKYYEDLGFYYTTNTDKDKDTNARYHAIYNDNIIQTEYPEELAKEIDEVYENANSFESFEVTKLIKVLKKKAELKVTVMRNPVIAKQLRNSILEKFEERKNKPPQR